MNKTRINKIKKLFESATGQLYLMVFEDYWNPEKSRYTCLKGTPGSKTQEITKEQWEELTKNDSNISVVIKRG